MEFCEAHRTRNRSQRKLNPVDNSKEWLDRMKSGSGLYWRGDGGYVSWDGEQEEICLDGDFSVEQLQLLIEHMKSVRGSTAGTAEAVREDVYRLACELGMSPVSSEPPTEWIRRYIQSKVRDER